MNDKLEDYLEGLLPSNMLRRSSVVLGAQLNLIRDLFRQRKVPKSGWPDDTISFLLKLLSMMDTDKDPEGVKVGEREARVASPLVSDLASDFCHGVGRSGSLVAPQPKAPGASVLYELANRCALDAMKRLGTPNVKSAFVSPMATGMSVALALAVARDSSDAERKTVVYPRADHNSPLKAISLVSLRPKVVEGKVYSDAVRVPVDDIAGAIDEHCCAILSTTTFFPPREADSIKEIAKIASEKNVFHIINNAYGVQSREIMREIRSAIEVGRVDATVQSTDKNFLTPVGGAIIASPDDRFVEKVASYYCGRASASPVYQFLAAILSLGIDGYERLRDIQQSNRALLQKLLAEFASSSGERLLNVKNPIACAVTITESDPNILGGILYSLRLSGPRVVPSGGWGSCCNDYPYSYVVMNAAIGSKESDVTKAVEKLKEGINQVSTRKGK
nr:O-phosphoseryl-tRNA(Sec) selenium transferase [Candidatus Njordarchaeum guaymaensis]